VDSALLGDRGAEEPRRVAHELGEVDGLDDEATLAGVREQLAGQLRGASAGGLDLLQHGVGGRALGEPFERQRRVAEDPHEEVVEVVGDAAGQDAQALEPLGLVLSELGLTRGLGDGPAIGDVAQGAADAGVRRPARRIRVDLEPADAARCRPPAALEAGRRRAVLEGTQLRLHVGAVVVVDVLGHRAPEALAERVSGDLLPRGVEEHPAPVGIGLEHHVAQRLHGGAVAGLAHAQGLDHPEPIDGERGVGGDVLHQRDHVRTGQERLAEVHHELADGAPAGHQRDHHHRADSLGREGAAERAQRGLLERVDDQERLGVGLAGLPGRVTLDGRAILGRQPLPRLEAHDAVGIEQQHRGARRLGDAPDRPQRLAEDLVGDGGLAHRQGHVTDGREVESHRHRSAHRSHAPWPSSRVCTGS